MTEQVRFEKGDVVRVVLGTSLLKEGTEHTVLRVCSEGPMVRMEVSGTGPNWTYGQDRFELVRRASESQREGGFAVGQRVRAKATAVIQKGRSGAVTTHVIGDHWAVLFDGDDPSSACSMGAHELEPANPAPAQPTASPQPAPMTRAASVLAGLERGAHGCNDCGAVVCLGDDIRCVYCAHRDDLVIEGGTASLDSRISLAREELDRKLPKNPPEGRSDRVYNGRRW